MMRAYAPADIGLTLLSPGADPGGAIWIDLYRPMPEQIEAVGKLGIEVPSLEDMEEIEISNRLYREGNVAYLTAVLPGQTPEGQHISGPVTFILTPERMITVRHHCPRPFETFPTRAARSAIGCDTVPSLFLSLIEDIIARLADLLEQAGKAIEETTHAVFGGREGGRAAMLQTALENVGRQADLMARVRLALLTIERALSFFSVETTGKPAINPLRPALKAMQRDLQALEVHLDFLSSRIGLTVDATIGMISLEQNNTVRILSVVAALFLPPTLIASVYGMNFGVMPELHWPWGYPFALGLMLGSAVLTYAFIKWKKWL